MKSWLHLLLGLLAITLTGVANAGVRASLDNDQVAPGDSVQLTLVHDGQTNDEPDLSPLDRDFDVLGRQSSTSVQVINGSASARTELTLTLSPKRVGTLTVPSINWGGERTSPLTLNVTSGAGGQRGSQGNGASAARSANVFIETEVDPKQPVVQSAVRVTVKLYIAETLYQANLDLPASGDVIVQKVGDDEQSEAVRNGRTYKVVTRHYLVFPQHSGTIELQGPVLSAQVADRRRSSLFDDDPFASVFGQSPFAGMTSTRPMRLHGDAITLNVQPRPPGFESGYWLPARQVTLEGEWSPANGQTHVGDPITLTLHLRAEGQTAAQLPDLSSLLALPDGVKAYPDQAKLDNNVRGDAVVGTRSQSIALIADTSGRFSIPDLKVRWWDTRTGQPRETTLPGKTLMIEPAAGAPSSATAQNPAASQAASGSAANASRSESSVPATGSGQSATPASTAGSHASATTATGDAGPWRWIALGLGVLWLATLAAWLGPRWTRSKRETASSASAGRSESAHASGNAAQARAEFHNACRKNDALAARRALLAWVRARSPDAAVAGLNAFAKQLDDPALAAQIRALDRTCFTGETWQDGPALAQALAELPAPKRATPSRRERASLAPLYP
ncbi:MAG TPA: BatD family protein [Steroidobacteraceae bacterium]|nr:BatD family protein [Steroidobacteraceae bacterium]